ncbi:hypothetical protein COCMIDRAFT_82580 [Bipolaris oryzae ATCC 44560]|uniref:Uncharacterized protein n=1 Tax=Bipolaris oryzae ATCC 44560 TaxID=930090 RepID=W7A286_COCMI|nr:uncharacterized protein COCMIDRAFT_82580 [Bipolaris oryzae ATCC 44560]EUC50136.1 hypothetical protein COCMIDRAFT_82580 [Bipolaris oryzae ATCC 44560]
MKEKIKAVLHRRKGSTPIQSPRASYEQSEGASPRAEHLPSSPRQSHRRSSSTSQSASPRTEHAQQPKTIHTNGTATHSATLPPESVHNTQLDKSASDENTPIPSALAPSKQSIVAGTNAGHSVPSHNDLSKPLPPTPSSTSYNQGDARDKLVGRAVTTNGSIVGGAQSPDLEGLARSPQSLGSEHHVHQDMAVKPAGFDSTSDTHDVYGGDEEWQVKQKSMLNGIIDLNDTVETDRETSWAPAVTHEVVKPHEHEIVQHKIYREIHNYTYYHRLQPVMQTEVLPPRHFIPNPDGEGLIEISADELPSRTGKNRWWDIVQKEPVLPEAPFQWRTEPQIIEGKPYMTDEGFERRETTIIYPPTLEDMSDYDGIVQPVHFDHKTGKRWLGELTTIDKLQRQVDGANEEDFMTMKNITADLPEIPNSPSVKRRPVARDSL